MAEIDRRAKAIGQRERTAQSVHARRVDPSLLRSVRAAPSPQKVAIPDVEVTTPVRPPPKACRLPAPDGERRYHQKPCEGCGEQFQPTGPRHRFCVACRPGRRRVVALAERVAELERRVGELAESA